MKMVFLGATHQVTGSCTLVEWKKNRFFLVDFGMEQGENDFEQCPIPVLPSQIEYVFLTHAHIDHTGLLPLLVRQGFKGTVYSTKETRDLCYIMLTDSANIQETDAAYETKKNLRSGGPAVEPLYTLQDVQETMKLFNCFSYGIMKMIDEGLSVRFNDAGHLLGSSSIEFFLEEDGQTRKFVCSGDVGNLNQPIIRDPDLIKEADYLLIESTYGTRLHDKSTNPIPLLVNIIKETFDRGGTVIIPSFAVGRTQELLYFFREIKQNNLLPEYSSFPVYLDSPMANEATAVFLQCGPECLDEETLQVMSEGENPIWFEGLFTTITSDESKALNADQDIKIIIASGGMCEGGRIRHHLKHNLWNSKNTILFVGYQATGTLGRIIYDGAKTVKIFGEQIDVNAEIHLLSGVSGHADRDGLIRWISAFESKPSHVFVNHGDDDSCTGFAKYLSEHFNLNAEAPYSGCEFDLLKGEWIKLKEPVLKRSTKAKPRHESNEKAVDFYSELQKAVDSLSAYVKQLKTHSNSELRQLTQKIKEIISDQG